MTSHGGSRSCQVACRARRCVGLVAVLHGHDGRRGRRLPPQEVLPDRADGPCPAQGRTRRCRADSAVARGCCRPSPVFNDYRAILHAHAEDSAHTGGTRPEMLADAKKVGVSAILLSNHFRPPTDFITDSWRGLHDGVLFIPGSEDRGFLLLPTRSIVARMKDPTALVHRSRHGRRRLDLPVAHRGAARPLDGRPDRHGDLQPPRRRQERRRRLAGDRAQAHSSRLARRNSKKACGSIPTSCSPRRWNTRPTIWRSGTPRPRSRRLTGVAANDCHHNQILLVKMVDAETVLIGTNVDRDDQMTQVHGDSPAGDSCVDQGPSAGRHPGPARFRPVFPLVSEREHAYLRSRAHRERDSRGPARRACVREPRLDVRSVRVLFSS